MCTNTQNKILFVAGGTGGHIFPAISVYNLFKNVNSNLYFATDQRGIRFEEISNIDPFLIKALGFERKKLIFKTFLIGCLVPIPVLLLSFDESMVILSTKFLNSLTFPGQL